MNQSSFFTIRITDSWAANNQQGGTGSRQFKLRARLNHRGIWLTYTQSQALFASANLANQVEDAHEVFGDTYIQIFPEDDPILYTEREDEYDDNEPYREDVWQVLNLAGYAPDGIEIYYEPGPWVELQTRNGGDENYPDHWNNINPHFGFQQLLTPAHFGEHEGRTLEIVGDDNYYDTFYARYIARTQHNHTWTRFQSIFRGRRARRHVQRLREQQRHLRHMRDDAQEAQQLHRNNNRGQRGQDMDDLSHLIDNIKLKF